MDINKLSKHINSQVNGAKAAENTEQAAKSGKVDGNSASQTSDKVSLSSGTAKSEELFAKIELEKLNQSSFDKLKGYKAKLQEYEAAKAQGDGSAGDTEIGKMLNNPDVWGKIAESIMDK